MSASPDSPRAVVAATHRAMLDGDLAAFASRFAEDAVLEFPFAADAALPARVEGRNSIRELAATIGDRFRRDGTRVRRLENVIVHETTDPEVLVVEFEALGDGDGGAGYRLPDIQVFRVKNGMVQSMRDYLGRRVAPRTEPPRTFGGSAWG